MAMKKKRRRRGHGQSGHRNIGAKAWLWKPRCVGCLVPIHNVMGSHVDRQGSRWHPACYANRDRSKWGDR